MNDKFSHKFKKAQPMKILQMLKESFITLDDVEQHKTSCAIFNPCTREGTSIINHVLYLIEQIDHLSKLGYPLHEQLDKDAILNSLPKFYLTFLSH